MPKQRKNQRKYVFLTSLTIFTALVLVTTSAARDDPPALPLPETTPETQNGPRAVSAAAEPTVVRGTLVDSEVAAAETPSEDATEETGRGRLAEAAYEFARAKLFADSGEFEAALAGFRRSLELDDSDPYSSVELAEFLSYLAQISRSPTQRLDHLDSAAAYAEQAKELGGDNVDVLRSYGQVHLRLVEQQQAGSIHSAKEAFQAIRERTEGDLHALISLAQIHMWQRDAVNAVEVLREAESYYPHHPSVEDLLADALLAAGRGPEAEEMLGQIVERQPGDIDRRLQLAELVSERGDHRGAVAVLRDGLQMHFENPQLRQLLARELHLSGDNQEALQVADTLLEEFPGRQSLQRLRVAILSALARFEDALDVLESVAVAGESKDSLEEDLYLIRLLERTGRAGEAEERLRALVAELSGERRLQAKVTLVGLLERQGRPDEAIDMLSDELDRASVDRVVAVGQMLIEFLIDQGRNDESIAVLDRLLGESLRDEIAIRLRLQKVAIQGLQERWDLVLEATAEMLTSDSREVRTTALLQRAEALAGLDRVDEALAELEAGQAQDGALPLLAKRVDLLFAEERREEAEAILATKTADGAADDLFFVAQLHQRSARYEEAIPFLTRILDEDPKSRRALYSLGSSYERTGRRQLAVETFQRLLADAPDNADALNYLGYMWAEQGENLDEALEFIQRAVGIEPNNGAFVDSLGWVHYQLGNYEEARQHLEWASRLVPNDPTILEHLGDLYVALQDLERARSTYRQALDLGTSDAIDELRRKLQNIEQKGL